MVVYHTCSACKAALVRRQDRKFPMSKFQLRPMTPGNRSEVVDLICVSTNYWYRIHGGADVFPAGPAATEVFFDVYQALDPGCGVVAEHPQTGRLMGSCFVHPRKRTSRWAS